MSQQDDLNAVIGVLAKELERGYVSPGQAITLANLIGDARRLRAPELSPAEAEIVAKFEAADPAPESYVQQHTSEPTCFCGPVQVGTLGVWTHRVVEP